MFAPIIRAFTSPAAGPAASAVALALAVVLAVSWTSGEAERAKLEAKLAQATQQQERAASLWRAQLAACHAAAADSRRLTETGYDPGGDPEAAARRLLSQGPEGIDVCARMESADEAVLATLKKK